MGEIGALKTKVNALLADVNAREAALSTKDLNNDRAEINRVAKEESDLLREAAALSRSIAGKASQAGSPQLQEKYRHYVELVAQHNLKYADMLDAMREQVELLLSNESGETINSRRAEARKRIEALRQEADDLYQRAEKLLH